jgi:hypothetical protein
LLKAAFKLFAYTGADRWGKRIQPLPCSGGRSGPFWIETTFPLYQEAARNMFAATGFRVEAFPIDFDRDLIDSGKATTPGRCPPLAI